MPEARAVTPKISLSGFDNVIKIVEGETASLAEKLPVLHYGEAGNVVMISLIALSQLDAFLSIFQAARKQAGGGATGSTPTGQAAGGPTPVSQP